MLPKRYHAFLFISVLVMLLLLGLHLLGIGYSSSQVGARTVALARNSSSQPSSSPSSLNAALSSPSQLPYRHPIVYDKITGATNNQINEVLGAKQQTNVEYPLDHYQQQQQQQQQQMLGKQAFEQQAQDDFFANIHRRPPGFPPMVAHPLARHHLHPMVLPPPPPPPPIVDSDRQQQQQQQQQQVNRQLGLTLQPNGLQTSSVQDPSSTTVQSTPDSLPSASSLTSNDTQRPPIGQQLILSTLSPLQQQREQQPQQQPLYYTPPIFAYNQFDQNRADQQQLQPYGFPAQVPSNSPQLNPPIGVPEIPLSVDEYNARQARLRQQQQQQQPPVDQLNPQQAERFGRLTVGGPQVEQNNQLNLLNDPQQQQRHRQQMLDRQQMFGRPSTAAGDSINRNLANQTSYYPDPAIQVYRNQQASLIRPPYVHTDQFGLKQQNNNNNRGSSTAPNIVTQQTPISVKSAQQQQQQVAASSAQVVVPACARQQMVPADNSSVQQVLLCVEDPDYPTKEIMRALEVYANERSIEQLLPQPLVQLQLAGRQLALDPLQPALTTSGQTGEESARQQQQPFPSSNYEQMCRATSYLAQPKRAKNLVNQWKVVVNLPGHKYRGIAVSQLVRVEECTRPNGECSGPVVGGGGGGNSRSSSSQQGLSLVALTRSRCLQQYENQRLVAWSPMQGLHVDIFRVPTSCACHIRR